MIKLGLDRKKRSLSVKEPEDVSSLQNGFYGQMKRGIIYLSPEEALYVMDIRNGKCYDDVGNEYGFNDVASLFVKNKKLLDTASVGSFTYNTLVFAGASGNALSMQGLVKLERIAIGSPKSVPAGEYATAAFVKAGIDKLLEKKLVMAKDVRECLMYAERGEVDGAFVYKTDALLAKQAKILFTVPQELYPRVTYPLSLTVTGAKNKDAVAFFTFLHGDEAKSVLTKYGFTTR